MVAVLFYSVECDRFDFKGLIEGRAGGNERREDTPSALCVCLYLVSFPVNWIAPTFCSYCKALKSLVIVLEARNERVRWALKGGSELPQGLAALFWPCEHRKQNTVFTSNWTLLQVEHSYLKCLAYFAFQLCFWFLSTYMNLKIYQRWNLNLNTTLVYVRTCLLHVTWRYLYTVIFMSFWFRHNYSHELKRRNFSTHGTVLEPKMFLILEHFTFENFE